MKTQVILNLAAACVAAVAFTGPSAKECLADPVCVNNSGTTKRVCVEWDKQAAPIEDQDFEVDYACQGCSDDPAVELSTGDTGWVVYSEVISTGAAANIGALTTTDSDNYVVKIAKGANAGAANVGSMVLTPDGAEYSSSIDSGSRISGDLTGNMTVQKSSGGSGGSVSFSVGGDVDGDMTIPIVSDLTIGGDLTSTGSITVSDKIDTGDLKIKGSVESGATITVADTVGSTVELEFNATSGDFAGTLTMSDGLAADQIITVFGAMSGSISFNSMDVASKLYLYGGGDGTVTGRDVVSGGLVELGLYTDVFSGTATFRNVASGRTIRTPLAHNGKSRSGVFG